MFSASRIFDNSLPFGKKALQLFEYQKNHNPVYNKFCEALGIHKIKLAREIPLLPIEAFKDAVIITQPNSNSYTDYQHLLYFKSSGTTGMQRSRHFVPNAEIYRQSILRGMRQFYELDDFVIWAYTPGYVQNPNSSLIYMLNILIENDASGMSRFLELHTPLNPIEIKKIQESGKKLMLFGAAFGLLDLAEISKTSLPEHAVILETGGMKTFKREMLKEDLHTKLANGFGLPEQNIHSEYGMAELLSQAYSTGDVWFKSVPWMQISIRNPDNPLEILPFGKEGLIGVMDLANVHSCAFILTGDKGLQRSDGMFQVLGRWNPKNLRGCNFLIDGD